MMIFVLNKPHFARLSKVRQMRSRVEEARSAHAQSHSRGRVLDALMAEKRNGKLRGIHGRLVSSPIVSLIILTLLTVRVTLAPLMKNMTWL